MLLGTGHIDETYIQIGRAGRILCAPGLVPAPGQYLLAHATSEPDAPLPTPVFNAGSHPKGFYAAQPLPVAWTPGTTLTLRGPLGRGFHLPAGARKIALAALGHNPARLLALLEPALTQKAAVALLTDHPPAGLPLSVEVLPLKTLNETAHWADYLALDAPRSALEQVRETLRTLPTPLLSGPGTEILVETPLPCGGMGECGICAIQTRKNHFLACKEGPVFEAHLLLK